MEQDVIVIGAGPAGCAAAVNCALSGLKVLLISNQPETAPDGGYRPSESVHPGISVLLEPLGARSCLIKARRGVYTGITNNGVFVPLGADQEGAWIGHHIDRHLFDQSLLRLAAAHGVTVTIHEPVTGLVIKDDRICGVTTTRKTYSCHFVVDASGYKAIAGRLLKWKPIFHSPPLISWTGLSSGIPPDFFTDGPQSTYFISSPSGWAWLAPEPEGRCSWTMLSGKGRRHFEPPELLECFSLIGNIKASNRRWRSFHPVCFEGLLVVGDAAGLIDPAAGQGIFNAILSATMAAKTIADCLKAPSFEALYLFRYNQWFNEYYTDKIRKLRYFYDQQGVELFKAKSS